MSEVEESSAPADARQVGVAPRSLADDLRRRDDGELEALLRGRPDLATPVPNDIATLAIRAAGRPSVQRALERFDRFVLQVVDALRVLPEPADPREVAALLDEPPEVGAALDVLRVNALVWGPPDALYLVSSAPQVLGPEPAGTGPALALALTGISPSRARAYLEDLGLEPTSDPVSATAAIRERMRDPAWMDALLATAPDQARAALERLAWGPPTGRMREAGRTVRAAEARGGLEWLLARALLVPADERTVVLPLEVALHLRGGHLYRRAETTPPAAATLSHDAAMVDRTAAGAAAAALRHVEQLLELWGTAPPPVLRGGGLGVRELRRTAVALDVPEVHAAFWAEIAYVAGLVGVGEEEWLPTPAYDAWLADEPARQWTVLVRSWLTTSRVAGIVGEKDDKGRVVGALGPLLDRVGAVEARLAALHVLADLAPGDSATAGEVLSVLAWRHPLLDHEARARLVTMALGEAEQLGLTGRGALASFARPLLAEEPRRQPAGGAPLPRARLGGLDPAAGAAASGLAGLLPAPVDHILLQADLTAIAPGPLTADLAREMMLLADVESTGGATVYRFTAGSVRRAFDAGRTSTEILDLLRTRSRTPVPQALEYLVTDEARRHGRLRVGQVAAYVRCEDEAALAELLADRRSAGLGLRRIAPTVAVTAVQPAALLEELRAIGHAPVAETPGGGVLLHRPDVRRAPSQPPPAPVLREPPRPAPTTLHAVVRAMRAGEQAASAAPPRGGPEPVGAVPRTNPSATLRILRDAAANGQALWIAYVNADGQASQRVIEPAEVDGGYVTAFDHLRDEVRTFAVHRIAGAAVVGDAER